MHAILIPYRDRAEHLAALLPVLHAHLAAIPHRVFVIEQVDNKPFNRGKLFNAGFRMLGPEHTTVVLHDVDLVPEHADYANITQPTHLSAHCSQFQHGPPALCFGGVVAFPVEQFRRVNGFSNDYWGWGAEDDDLRDRCGHAGLHIQWRQGRYRSLPHMPASAHHAFGETYTKNLERLLANQQGRDREYDTNGLNSLEFTLAKAFDTCTPEGTYSHTTCQVEL